MNQRIRTIVCFSLILVLEVAFATTYLDRQEFMSVDIAKKKYGNMKFDAVKFKGAKTSDRAKMAVNLVLSKNYIGKPPEIVKKDLGPNSGYFWSDLIPAYFIEEGRDKTQDSWQLVFLINENALISEVKIHKNCCNRK